eukprot:403339211
MNQKQSKNFVELNESQPTEQIIEEKQTQQQVEPAQNKKQIKNVTNLQNLKDPADQENQNPQNGVRQNFEYDEENGNNNIRRESFQHFVHRDDFPRKAAFLAIVFTLLGGFMITAGFLPLCKDWDPFHGGLFWGAGLALLIPGLFYIVKICQAYKAQDEGDRQELLNEIPEL